MGYEPIFTYWLIPMHIWLKQEESNRINLGKLAEDSKKGLICEVDLEYLEELHDLLNDSPCAAEKLKVTQGILSPYWEKIRQKDNMSTGVVHKLIPALGDKKKYVLHYRNLQLYIDFELKLKKVHSILEFDQSPWLKQYIY